MNKKLFKTILIFSIALVFIIGGISLPASFFANAQQLSTPNAIGAISLTINKDENQQEDNRVSQSYAVPTDKTGYSYYASNTQLEQDPQSKDYIVLNASLTDTSNQPITINSSSTNYAFGFWVFITESTANFSDLTLLINVTFADSLTATYSYTLTATTFNNFVENLTEFELTPTEQSIYNEQFNTNSKSGWYNILIKFNDFSTETAIADNTELTITSVGFKESFTRATKIYQTVDVYNNNSGWLNSTTINNRLNPLQLTQKQSLKDYFSESKYYINEYLKMPLYTDLVTHLVVGDQVYMYNDALVNSSAFRFVVKEGNSNQIKELTAGLSEYKLNNMATTIWFQAKRPNQETWFDIDKIELPVASYGSGVYFIDGGANLNVGETIRLKYYVEPIFNGAIISFNAEDESVIQISRDEIDLANNTITVKALKKGSSKITITLESERLLYTDLQSLVNTDMIVSVEEVKQSKSFTTIFLWVSLVGIVGVGLYFGITSIIKQRKLEVK